MKLAVIFPGIGYHTDKPLLYYSKKIAKEFGYEIKEVSYSNFPKDVKSSQETMWAAFHTAYDQAEKQLAGIDFKQYEEVLFISKSIGTAVASCYAKTHTVYAYQIYYTPVEGVLERVDSVQGIVFSGTKDPWVTVDVVQAGCDKCGIPLYITEDANHSLETGDVMTDINNLNVIMARTRNYIANLG